jgi:hypothetical protein
MIKTPQIKIASDGVHLMTGRRLNELVAAVQARTQMDPANVGPRGMTGRNPKGGGPKIPKFRQRFDEHKTYVLSEGFLSRLTQAIHMRTPREAGGMDARGWDADGGGIKPQMVTAGSSGGALKDVLEAIERLTPRDAAETGPQGYRFAPDPRPPRRATIILRTQARWAEAFYCTGIFNSGQIYSTKTITAVYQNGTIVTTITQPDIGTHLFNPSNPIFFSCPGTHTEDDRVPGKNYGTLKSSSTDYSGSVSLGDAFELAKASVEVDGDPVDAYTWSWLEYASPVLGSYIINLAQWQNPGLGDYIVRQPRYRWSNTGALHVGVRWTEAGVTRDITLAPGEDSSWYNSTLPAVKLTSSKITGIELIYPVTA